MATFGDRYAGFPNLDAEQMAALMGLLAPQQAPQGAGLLSSAPMSPNPQGFTPGIFAQSEPPPMPPPATRGILPQAEPPPQTPTPPMQRQPGGNVVGPPQSMTPLPVNQAPPNAKPEFSLKGLLSGVNNSLQENPMITGLAMGLLSGPNFGQGISSGLKYGSDMATSANKSLLDKTKLAREQAQLDGIAQLFIKDNPQLSVQEARGLAGNASAVQELYKRMAPAEVFRTHRDESGNLVQTDDRSGKVNILRPADETYTQLTDPAERRAAGIPDSDRGIYRKSSLGKIEAVGSPSTNVNVNTAANPIVSGAGEHFVEQLKDARAAGDTIRAVQSARQELTAPGGVVAGKFANERLQLQKLGALFGVSDSKGIVNTETFVTQIKPIVLSTIKGLGAGSAISNADREFALQAVGGDITLDPGTLARVLDVTERAAREKIERHNKTLGALQETAGPQLQEALPILRVNMPEAMQPQAPVGPAPLAPNPVRKRFNPKTGGFE